MPIMSFNGTFAFVRMIFDVKDIPSLLRRHEVKYPKTYEIEREAELLIKQGFKIEPAKSFVRNVCNWGRGHRFVDRVISDNDGQAIALALQEGYQKALQCQIVEGVETIRQLNYLGQSFASKQLRFLSPTHAVILDYVIRSALGYAETPAGYREFLDDCRDLLNHARASKITSHNGEPLRVADVEAAIFSKIQGL